MLASSSFSIVCNDLTQGMMIVDTVSKRSRINIQRNQHLVYVEYVQNAPWNRGELFDQPRYRGVGSILIRAAISLSKELEFHGRIEFIHCRRLMNSMLIHAACRTLEPIPTTKVCATSR